MRDLQYSKQALKCLRKMPRVKARKLHSALPRIAAGHETGLSIKKMSGIEAYRLRLGDYRARYEFLDDHSRMVVGKIGVRGGFYK